MEDSRMRVVDRQCDRRRVPRAEARTSSTRSIGIDEALTLFLKAILEVKRGRRLVTLDPRRSQPACELATPTLSALEWALQPEALMLPAEALGKMRELTEAAPKASPRLRGDRT
jgi:hypothetical protein